jgi:integrase
MLIKHQSHVLLAEPGKRHRAGVANLSLSTKNGGRSWSYRHRGKEHSLGPATGPRMVTHAQAQKQALELNELTDPLEQLKKAKAQKKAKAVTAAQPAPGERQVRTFREWCDDYLSHHGKDWTALHVSDVKRQLEIAHPVLGDMPVNQIDTEHILEVLEPIWSEKNQTAVRLRMRIEAVLARARAKGDRPKHEQNPAAWRGNLAEVLKRPSKVHKVENFPSMPFAEVPALITELRARDNVSALALEFQILTAARPGMVLKARRNEIDLGFKAWIVPVKHMKDQNIRTEPFRVPLSPRALEIAREMLETEGKPDDYLFRGLRNGPLGRMTMLHLLKYAMGHKVTPHGFRSSFKDWARKRTSFADELSEQALAHKVGNAVRQAYARDDLFDERRPLMDQWAAFCGGATGDNVVPLRVA